MILNEKMICVNCRGAVEFTTNKENKAICINCKDFIWLNITVKELCKKTI